MLRGQQKTKLTGTKRLSIGHGILIRWPIFIPERRWMMLIIEIHVDTIENEDSSPSTHTKREDERPTEARKRIKHTGNRFWESIKVSIPGSLKSKNKK
jgi:hypothetical protein